MNAHCVGDTHKTWVGQGSMSGRGVGPRGAGSILVSRQKVRASGKPTAVLGWVAGWEQRALSSPSIGGFGGQARRCPMSHQSHIPLEAEGGVR